MTICRRRNPCTLATESDLSIVEPMTGIYRKHSVEGRRIITKISVTPSAVWLTCRAIYAADGGLIMQPILHSNASKMKFLHHEWCRLTSLEVGPKGVLIINLLSHRLPEEPLKSNGTVYLLWYCYIPAEELTNSRVPTENKRIAI